MKKILKYRLKISILVLVLLMSSDLHANNVKFVAKAQLNTNYIKIGDQATLTLNTESPASGKLMFPSFSDTLNAHIQVVSKSKIDTTFSNDKQQIILTQKLLITAFDTGYFPIAPFLFVMDRDTQNAVSTEALLLQVQTVPVDTTKAIKDIKGPKDAPWSIREWIPYILAACIGILFVLLVIYYNNKRKSKQVVVQDKKPDVPPHIYALEQLRILQEERLWQSGQYKLYQIQLSDIIRNYINNRFKINAMEQTSDETMRSFRGIHLEDDTKLKLRQLLMLSDMVKFAKEEPLASENEKSMQDAIDFIMVTANNYAEQERKEDLK